MSGYEKLFEYLMSAQAHCDDHHHHHHHHEQQVPDIDILQRSYEGTLKRACLSWDFLELVRYSTVSRLGDLVTVYKALASDSSSPSSSASSPAFVRDFSVMNDWYQKLARGESELQGALKGAPLSTRDFQRALLRVEWISRVNADKIEDALTFYKTLFAKEHWEAYEKLTNTANTASGGSSTTDSDMMQAQEILQMKRLAIELSSLNKSGSRSFTSLRTDMELLQETNAKIIDKHHHPIFLPNVCNWAQEQVQRAAKATTLDELSQVLREAPYNRFLNKSMVSTNRSTRKLLKIVRLALFLRFDELVA
jgi:predicted glycoside hydrolase/deacetylase ChbG (UPF0249 family)